MEFTIINVKLYQFSRPKWKEHGRKSYKINDEIIVIQTLRHVEDFRSSEGQLPFHNTVTFKSKLFRQ